MKALGLIILFLTGLLFAQASFAYQVYHTVTKDETAWFIASIYYAKGERFPEILSANSLNHPDDIKEGQKLKIPEPRFYPSISRNDETFAERYARLWHKRSAALKMRLTASVNDSPLPHSKVVIPTHKIREQDSVNKLPFTEVRDPNLSPKERAERELDRQSVEREQN